jgi:predicted naringenin-chalcone synthase
VQGGKSILAGIEEALSLKRWQTECSWEVLKNYGNMVRADV